MGHVNAPMILGTLSVIEMALAALRIPYDAGGVQAAIEHLAAQVPAPNASPMMISKQQGNCCGDPGH